MTLSEETAESAVDKRLDFVKLNELKETDTQVYNTFLEELKGKYEQWITQKMKSLTLFKQNTK